MQLPDWWKSDKPYIIGNCLEHFKDIPDNSVDMILCDLPYGMTNCSWDSIIPLDKLWAEYERIIKENGAIVLTASQPFTSILVCSNPKLYRHSWIYQKRCASNFAQAKYSPMKEHEDVLVFAKNKPNYYPIMEQRRGSGSDRVKYKFGVASRHKSGEFIGQLNGEVGDTADELRYPSSVQEFNNRAKGDRGSHPTQKPVALFEYLIKTYTKEGEIVLDNCLGSGTTLVACKNTGRVGIGFEIEEKYEPKIQERINQEQTTLDVGGN